MTSKKPPLGLKPQRIHERQRLDEIVAAMKRYLKEDISIPSEWTQELIEIIERRIATGVYDDN